MSWFRFLRRKPLARCSVCGATSTDVALGLPDGWGGSFRNETGMILTCGNCLSGAPEGGRPERTGFMAVLRPLTEEVALFVPAEKPGEDGACAVLSLAEARALHGAIGNALALAECPGRLPNDENATRGATPPAAGDRGAELPPFGSAPTSSAAYPLGRR